MDGNFSIGIDTGGTFTDIVVSDETGNVREFKVASTPQNLVKGVLAILKKASNGYGTNLRDFLSHTSVLIHGTTVGTNAAIQHTGGKTGLLTTRGFRDVLEIRRGRTESMWDLRTPPVPVLVPRYLRLGVKERINAKGEVVTPLDEDDVRACVSKLRKEEVESIAVCLLFSFLNPIHEQRVGEIIRQEFPNAYVCLSHEISPKIRDYERMSTTVVNAYLKPVVSKYLGDLVSSLNSEGFQGGILVMANNGGCLTVTSASESPALTLMSGPAGGSAGAAVYASMKGFRDLILIDIGGTSFDASFVKNFQPLTTTALRISGYDVNSPAVDIYTVGAGGGSILWVDPGGLLHLGPASAEAYPGPACYGYGGKKPTFTDVCLLSGYINPNNFLGGEFTLDVDSAKRAVEKDIASALNITLAEAISAVMRVAVEQMSDAIREVSTYRGEDPRRSTLLVTGGAGPMCAPRLAEELGILKVYILKGASTFSAWGMLQSDIKHEYVRTYVARLDNIVVQRLREIFLEMQAKAKDIIVQEGLSTSTVDFERTLEMRYVGQHSEVSISLPEDYGLRDASELLILFHQKHQELHGFHDSHQDAEVFNIRLTAINKRPKPRFMEIKKSRPSGSVPTPKLSREAYFEEYGYFIDCLVYDGNSLYPNDKISGPAIIEETDTTVVVYPSQEAVVDEYGNYVVYTSHNKSHKEEGR